MKAGVAINPATPVSLLRDIVADLDLVLLMSVNPGFGGQKFIEGTLRKITDLRNLNEECGASPIIEVDGGVNEATGARLAQVGAQMLVAGNYVFKNPNPEEAISTLVAL